MLGTEVGTVVAPFVRIGPSVPKRNIDVGTVVEGDYHATFYVDLRDAIERDAHVLLDLSDHEGVVIEGLATHEADDQLHRPHPPLDPFGREVPHGRRLARDAD